MPLDVSCRWWFFCGHVKVSRQPVSIARKAARSSRKPYATIPPSGPAEGGWADYEITRPSIPLPTIDGVSESSILQGFWNADDPFSQGHFGDIRISGNTMSFKKNDFFTKDCDLALQPVKDSQRPSSRTRPEPITISDRERRSRLCFLKSPEKTAPARPISG